MHVRRGRAATIDADESVTEDVIARANRKREPTLRLWCPHRQVAFGRQDTNTDGYEAAREAAQTRGFEASTRGVGGRAVAFTGDTVAVVHAVPIASSEVAIQDRYEDAMDRLARALADVGVQATRGEPADSFCPGTHSLSTGGKVVGVAQRVRQSVAVVAAVVVVTGHDAIAEVLSAVYDAMDQPFDPASVGSIDAAGGQTDPDAVCSAIERAFRER